MAAGDISRHGRTWDRGDYEVLVAAMRKSLSPSEAAQALCRTTGAVTSRAKYLLPVESDGQVQRTSSESYAEAMRFVADRSYDWLVQIRFRVRRAGLALWDQDSDETFSEAWIYGSPNAAQLAERYGTSSAYVTRRFIELGLASNSDEVSARFGPSECVPDSRKPECFLLVFGEGGRVKHLSSHSDVVSAALARDGLLPTAGSFVDTSEILRWTIVSPDAGGGIEKISSVGEFYAGASRAATDAVESAGSHDVVELEPDVQQRPGEKIFICPDCASAGSWSVPTYAVWLCANDPDASFEALFRCLYGHLVQIEFGSTVDVNWLKTLPQLPHDPSDGDAVWVGDHDQEEFEDDEYDEWKVEEGAILQREADDERAYFMAIMTSGHDDEDDDDDDDWMSDGRHLT